MSTERLGERVSRWLNPNRHARQVVAYERAHPDHFCNTPWMPTQDKWRCPECRRLWRTLPTGGYTSVPQW